jgi:hypothetical protein
MVTRVCEGLRLYVSGNTSVLEAQIVSDVIDVIFSKYWKTSYRYFPDEGLCSLWGKISEPRRARIIEWCTRKNISYKDLGIEAPCPLILKQKRVERYLKRESRRIETRGKIGYYLTPAGAFLPQVKREEFFFKLPTTRDETEAKNLADLLIYIVKGETDICNNKQETLQEKFQKTDPFFKFYLEEIATKTLWKESKQAWMHLTEGYTLPFIQVKRAKKEWAFKYSYQFKYLKILTEKPLTPEFEQHFKGEKKTENIFVRMLKHVGKPLLIYPRLSSMYWIQGKGYVPRKDWKTIVGQKVLNQQQSINARAEEIGVSCIGLFKVLRENSEFEDFFESIEYNQDVERNRKKPSRIEDFLQKFLEGMGEKIVLNHKPLFHSETSRKLELDLYLPDRGIAFECNGNYWHSSATGKDRRYHKTKTDLCFNKGIKLYHLWEGSEEKILNVVKAKLGLLPKIGARKCKVVRVSHEESREFFNRNHTHGYTVEFVTYGLEYEGRLVSALAFRRLGEGVENARFAFDGCTVVGGFTKLLTAFMRDYEGQFKEIISFCDRDLTPDYHDSVYFKNGFEFLGDSGLSMWYLCNKTHGEIHKQQKYSRQKFQKHKLKDIFPDYNGENVRSFLESKQIFEIWNSGNWKFRLYI